MPKKSVKIFLVALCVLAFSLAVSAQSVQVSGVIDKASVKTGKKAKGKIILSIPHEIHVNSNKPTSEFLIPTEITVSSRETKNVKINYPKGIDRKFDFSDEKLNVYEGKTPISFSFDVPKGTKGRTVNMRVTVSYQACSNEVCYQPQKKELILKAKVL